MKQRIGAVVLAAGQGKRMQSRVAKQFLELNGRPLIAYALEAFEKSQVDEVILVTGQDEISYCERKIVAEYGFSKVKAVVAGGKERYNSVYEGLKAFQAYSDIQYVLIHDGARPLISEAVIERAIEGAIQYDACVVGMPVKDTIKVANEAGFAAGTPDRASLWQIQTPQAFRFDLILDAYKKIMERPEDQEHITDDAMVVEAASSCQVKLVEGDYRNIKVTTPEDLLVAEAFLKKKPSQAGLK